MYCIKEPILFHLNKTSGYRDNLGSDDWINNVPKTDNASLLHHYQLCYRDVLLGKEFGPFAAKNKEQYDAYIQAMGYPYVDLIQ
jgi:hypothetical protein